MRTYIEKEKLLLWLIKEKGLFSKGKLIRSFFRTNGVTQGFVPGDDVSLRTMETAQDCLIAPFPLAQGSPF